MFQLILIILANFKLNYILGFKEYASFFPNADPSNQLFSSCFTKIQNHKAKQSDDVVGVQFGLQKSLFQFQQLKIFWKDGPHSCNYIQIGPSIDQNNRIAVVDCHASCCGPCKQIAPYVEKRNQETGIALIKVDVDKSAEFSQAYKVQAMPTFVVIKGKLDKVIETVIGGGESNVEKVFTKAKSSK